VKVGDKGHEGGGSRPSGFFNTGSASGDGKPCAPGYADPDGTETVDAWDCVDGCPVAAVSEASGERTSGAMRAGTPRKNLDSYTGGFNPSHATKTAISGDTGTAARFWQQFPFEDPEAPSLLVYAPKVSPSERWCLSVCGCGAKAMLLDAAMARTEARPGPGGEAEDTCVDCNNPRVVHVHPTQKGVALMRWLVRLVTRPGDLVIDPFCGSGTTGVAAVMEGRRFLGIELDAEGEGHADVARERIRSAFLVGPRSTKRSFVRDSQAQARIESGAKYEQKAFKF
jgi:site-specific DNA-methyltransferase (adenine-specific)